MHVRFSKRKPEVKTFTRDNPVVFKPGKKLLLGEYKIPKSKRRKGAMDLNAKINIVLHKTKPQQIYITYADSNNISDTARLYINGIPPEYGLTWRSFVRYPFEGFRDVWIMT